MENEMQNKIINPAYLTFKKRLEVMSKDLKLKSKKFSKETNTQLGSELESELKLIKIIIENIYNHIDKKELLELIKPELLILYCVIITTSDMLVKLCDYENVEILKLKADYLIKIIRQILDIIKYF